jgi:hypothetical protein
MNSRFLGDKSDKGFGLMTEALCSQQALAGS